MWGFMLNAGLWYFSIGFRFMRFQFVIALGFLEDESDWIGDA